MIPAQSESFLNGGASDQEQPSITKTARDRVWRKRRLQIAAGAVLMGMLLWGIGAFLSLNAPIKADVLVVEGWFPNHPALAEAAARFATDGYDKLVVFGTPASAAPEAACDADQTAARLIEHGVPEDRLVVLRTEYVSSRRTLTGAKAVRDWLIKEYPSPPRAINVFTLGVHARRSRLLFRLALQDQAAVGVIAGTETNYRTPFWYLSANGWRCVTRNTAGYLLHR